jgi:hypothetical protein
VPGGLVRGGHAGRIPGWTGRSNQVIVSLDRSVQPVRRAGGIFR